jgi:hypothetical protein
MQRSQWDVTLGWVSVVLLAIGAGQMATDRHTWRAVATLAIAAAVGGIAWWKSKRPPGRAKH